VLLLGTTADECGGSEYHRWLAERAGVTAALGAPAPWVGGNVPRVDFARTRPLYRALAAAHREGLVRSATTPGRGGWALAFARTALAGDGLGLELDLAAAPDLAALAPDTALFAESNGRFLVTVRERDAARFAERFAGLPCRRAGRVTAGPRLVVRCGGDRWIDADVSALERAFAGALAHA